MHEFLRALFPRLAALTLASALVGTATASPVAAPTPAPAASAATPGEVPGSPTTTTLVAAPETAFVDRFRDQASGMVMTAMNFLGVPYRRGGQSAEHGFDCSGFTRRVFENSLGLLLPRRADEQAKAPGLVAIMRNDLQPGDLVFFNTLRRTFSHVGIYIGDGKFIHAPRPGGEVRVEDMGLVYWAKRFTGARRAEPDVAVPTVDASLPVAPVTASTLAPALR